MVDDPEVHEGPRPEIDHGELARQVLHVDHRLEAVGVGDRSEDGGALLQEEVERLGLELGAVVDLLEDLRGVHAGELPVDDEA